MASSMPANSLSGVYPVFPVDVPFGFCESIVPAWFEETLTSLLVVDALVDFSLLLASASAVALGNELI